MKPLKRQCFEIHSHINLGEVSASSSFIKAASFIFSPLTSFINQEAISKRTEKEEKIKHQHANDKWHSSVKKSTKNFFSTEKSSTRRGERGREMKINEKFYFDRKAIPEREKRKKMRFSRLAR